MASHSSVYDSRKIDQVRDLAGLLHLSVPEDAPPAEVLESVTSQLYSEGNLPVTEEEQTLLGVSSQELGWHLLENTEELERGIQYLELATTAYFLCAHPIFRAQTHAALGKMYHLLHRDQQASQEFIAAGHALRFAEKEDTWSHYAKYPAGSEDRDKVILSIDVIDPYLLVQLEQEARRQLETETTADLEAPKHDPQLAPVDERETHLVEESEALAARIISSSSHEEAARLSDELQKLLPQISDIGATERVLEQTAAALSSQDGTERLRVRLFDHLRMLHQAEKNVTKETDVLLKTVALLRRTGRKELLKDAFDRANVSARKAAGLESYVMSARAAAERAALFLKAGQPHNAVQTLEPLVSDVQLNSLSSADEIRQSGRLWVLLSKAWSDRGKTENPRSWKHHIAQSNNAAQQAENQFQRLNEPDGFKLTRAEFDI